MDAPKRKRVSLVAAYDGHGRLLLGLRRDCGRYTLPGGHVEEGEKPADAAVRELREEAGLTAGPLTKVQVQPNPPELPEIHVFSTTVAGRPHGHLDPDGECDEWAWHPVADGLAPAVWDRLYGPPGDLNVVRQLHYRGEELSKGEGLGKMAIKDFAPGRLVGHSPTGDEIYDYNHVLRESGGVGDVPLGDFNLQVLKQPTSNFMIARLYHKDKHIGSVKGSLASFKGKPAIEPHSDLAAAYRGKGLGQAMYEALYRHAMASGVRRVQGGPHSNAAGRVHEALADRHDLNYSPAPPSEADMVERGPYGYPLKSEPETSADPAKSRRFVLAHPHAYGWHHGEPSISLVKDDEGGVAHATNAQAGLAGTSGAYHQIASGYGKVSPGTTPNLKFWPGLEHKHQEVNQLVQRHGYTPYYAGGKHGRADLGGRNYTTCHLMIWDPSSGSGGDFGHEKYTDAWRKIHELGHAETLPEVNRLYGEGARMGRLGKHRTMREALRSVHWEHLALHRQRDLAREAGVHISDEDFAREHNTVMHDAVHRAITGKFTEPAEEGFHPDAVARPVEHSLGLVRQAGAKMGLQDDDSLMGKSEPVKHGILAKDEALEGEHNLQSAFHHEGPPPALAHHILFQPDASVGMISGEAPRAPSAPGGHEGLVQDLRQLGLQHEETHGSYGGPERSVIVHNPTLAQMYHLGQKYGQESIVHGEGGRHRLVYTTGPHAGMYHPALARVRHSAEAPEDFYTALPGNGHVSLYFNFDKLLRLDPKELDLTRKAEGRGLPGRVVPGHAGDEHLVVRAVKHGLLVSGRELGRKRHQELLRSWPPLAFEGLAKVQPTPTFPKLGMPEDRRETPIVDTPRELRSKVYALSAAGARTMSPEAAAAERAHGRAAGASLSATGEVSTVPGFRTGYAASGGLRGAAGLTRKFPELHGHPMAPVATQAHENWHMMMNRVRERFGSQPAQDVAEHLFSSIPEDARRHLQRFASRRSSMRPGHPYYHEETLALLHNWLNNPGERSTYFQHFSAKEDERRIIDGGIKKAYRHVRQEAARLTPQDVYRINDEAERRRGGLLRAEPLGKAISQLPAGQPIEVPHTFSPGIFDAPPRQNERFFHRAYDYSHLLPEGQAHMRLVVHHTGIEGGGKHPRAERIRAWMYDATRPNDRVGQVIGYVKPAEPAGKALRAQPRAVEPHSELDETYRGRGLGTAMYEAAYAHARHVAGVTHVRGGSHSQDADAVHRRLAAKHGFAYKPVSHDETDSLYPHGPYAYTLKAEAVPGDDEAALLGSPAPLEFGRDEGDAEGIPCPEPRLEDLAADRGAAALLDHHDPGERWLGARAGDLSPGDHLRALLDDDPDVRVAAHERPMSDYTLRLLAAARVGRDGRHPGAQVRDGLGRAGAHAGHGRLAEEAASAGGRDGAREALEQVGPLRAAMEGLGKAEELDKAVLDPALGYTISHRPPNEDEVSTIDGRPDLIVEAHHPAGERVGHSMIHFNDPRSMRGESVWVHPDHRRLGIASAMYAHAEQAAGRKMVPSESRTDQGHMLWRGGSRRQKQFGKAEDLVKMAVVHDDPLKPMTVYRVEGPDGKGPHMGAHAPEVDEAVAYNQHLQPGPHRDFTHQDLVQTGFSLNPPEIGDDVSDDEAQRNYTTWRKQLGDSRRHLFAFERPEHAVSWFGQPALDAMKQHGYELRPVQARKVWRSQSGKQVIYLPHEVK